jgi:hypothetical protein
MRCVWECGRPAIPADGQAHPLVAACETGSVQRSVEVSEGGVSRWRVDGAAGVRVRSCDGFDEPLIPIRGVNRPGVLVAPLKAGTYFADAVVEAGRAPVLAVSVAPAEGLWWTECAQAQPLADDLASLGSLSLFYPQSDVPRFTRFATGTDRQSDVLFRPPGVVSGSLCAECNSTVCDFFMGQQGYTPFILPGNVLQLAPSPAVTVSFHWR